MKKIRKAGNKNRFYPADPTQIDEMIHYWNKTIKENIKDENILKLKPKAIISPHAGYVFSGFTANMAHSLLANTNPKRVIVIGPSHHVYIRKISIAEFDYYESPYGNIEIDTAYTSVLKQRFNMEFEPDAHFLEHSTETQIPFIKKYLPDTKVIELIYGNITAGSLTEIINYILEDSDNAIVISTDLSHFHDLETAEKIDRNCLIGVAEKNIELLQNDCEACGKTGIIAITQTAKDKNLQSLLLDYRTSADVSGDKSRVVGYMSAAIF